MAGPKFRCAWSGCDKSYTRKHKLKEHVMSIHRGEKPIHCPVRGCTMAFSNRPDCARHKRTHSKSMSRYVCMDCQRTFGRQDTLLDHRKKHCPSSRQLMNRESMTQSRQIETLDESAATCEHMHGDQQTAIVPFSSRTTTQLSRSGLPPYIRTTRLLVYGPW